MLERWLAFCSVVLIFIASQVFWVWQIRKWGVALIRDTVWRRRLGVGGMVLYLLLFSFTFLVGRRAAGSTHLTWRAALVDAPFGWWVVCSLAGFLIALFLGFASRIARAAHRVYGRIVHARSRTLPPPTHVSLARRRFLERTAFALTAAPFVAGAYGMFYERLNVEITRQRIKIPRLPSAFEGFRIAQLSDIHIGPFMPADEIRRYVNIVNQLKPELIALTGDYVTWDAKTQSAAVDVLAGLKAPLGIYGCLGNHEMWARVEDSITRLFERRGIRILRSQQAFVTSGADVINVIGVDYQTQSPMGPRGQRLVREYLAGVQQLLAPDHGEHSAQP